MSERMDVSVVISTYNGEASLPGALDSVLSQDHDGVSYEVIVVDNNSHDATRTVIESAIARGAGRLRYVFEPRQGVSYGRNAGIAAASDPIIAFFDDDVRVARDWIRTLTRRSTRPDVDFVGGKVLPEWQAPPAMADRRSLVAAGARGLWTRAAARYSRTAVVPGQRESRGDGLCSDAVGLFAPELQRVRTHRVHGGSRVADALLECRQTGAVRSHAHGEHDDACKPHDEGYHRRWHRGHGMFCAMMRYASD